MKWEYKTVPDSTIVQKLSKELNINEDLSSILVQRGVTTFQDAKDFFRPQLAQLHDPFLMKGMSEAVDLLSNAIAKGSKVLIYGDYDVDGCTSVALVYGFLREFTEQISYYIPNRFREGYGVSEQGVTHAIDNGIDLVITLDCGITASDQIQKLREQDIDVIVCDHHLPEHILPNAIILNPKQALCDYPFKELCGVGVGFKLLQGFCLQQSIDLNKLFEHLDLVAMGTCADLVSMVGENRILTYHGLRLMNDNPCAGIKALLGILGKDEVRSVSDIVFFLSPRINACGRIAEATQALELLIEKDYTKAQELAEGIEKINLKRKELDAQTFQEAESMIEQGKSSTVLYDPSWHKGVIGIVASRCIEVAHRPTIILTKSDSGLLTGSVRSVGSFDVHSALTACSDFLVQFGGHKAAAGLTLTEDNLPMFKEAFETYVQNHLYEEDVEPTILMDLDIPLARVNMKFLNILEQMGPFGPDHMTPIFSTKAVQNGTGTKIVGKEGNHLKVQVVQSGEQREGIAFGRPDLLEVMEKENIDLAYSLEINNFRGVKTPQLTIRDIK